MIGAILLMLLGLAGLIVASDLAVGAAKVLARALGVSRLLIGLTIASIGTSLPIVART